MQAAVADEAFDVEYAYWFVPLACGHTAAEHTEAIHNWQAAAWGYVDDDGDA